MSNESSVFQVIAGGTDKRVTAQIALVDANGDEIALAVAAALPALPTEDGNYQLTVASGVYSWTEIV